MSHTDMQTAVQKALDFGFSHACPLDVATLEVRSEVCDACAQNKCGQYGKSWACPPANGTLEENMAQMQGYRAGIIVQTTGELKTSLDYKAMMRIVEEHNQRFRAFRKELNADYPGLLALGAGGCKICEACSYPDAPCRLPNEMTCSMEGYGLVVNDVCKKNGIPYYHGPGTMTYIGCYLLL